MSIVLYTRIFAVYDLNSIMIFVSPKLFVYSNMDFSPTPFARAVHAEARCFHLCDEGKNTILAPLSQKVHTFPLSPSLYVIPSSANTFLANSTLLAFSSRCAKVPLCFIFSSYLPSHAFNAIPLPLRPWHNTVVSALWLHFGELIKQSCLCAIWRSSLLTQFMFILPRSIDTS